MVTGTRTGRLQGNRLHQHRRIVAWVDAARGEHCIDTGNSVRTYVSLGGDGPGPDRLANRSRGELLREPRTRELDNAEHHEQQEKDGEYGLHDRRPPLCRKPPRPTHLSDPVL